jgi:hypothetical protein
MEKDYSFPGNNACHSSTRPTGRVMAGAIKGSRCLMRRLSESLAVIPSLSILYSCYLINHHQDPYRRG